MDQNRIWVLMARKLADEASPAELLELEQLLASHPQYQVAFELTQTYWHQHPDTPLTDREIEAAVDRILHTGETEAGDADPVWQQWEQSRRRSRIRRRRLILGGLMGAAIALAAGLWLYPRNNAPAGAIALAPKETQVQTRMGTRTNLLLPDGTSVWLNAGSVLTYPSTFSGPNREVTLEGEAFFDVAKNATHPFIVHASTVNIRVLGTSFDVKAYAQDKTMETTLIKGSIEVTYRKARIVLKPNQKLVVAKEEDTTYLNAAPGRRTLKEGESQVNILKPTYEARTGAIIETSWTDNKLIFQDEAFGDLATQMERWYGVTVTFDRPALRDLRFTGSFQKETIQQALEALQLTADFKYSINGNQITIYER